MKKYRLTQYHQNGVYIGSITSTDLKYLENLKSNQESRNRQCRLEVVKKLETMTVESLQEALSDFDSDDISITVFEVIDKKTLIKIIKKLRKEN